VEPILHFLLRDWQVVPYLADPVTDPPNPHKQHWAVYERTDRTVERDGTQLPVFKYSKQVSSLELGLPKNI
jgi:hypothetical protein